MTYSLRHVDADGVEHVWLAQDTSVHFVARWHARDSGRATEVWRDGRLVTTWHPAGGADPPYGWQDEADDGDAPSGLLRASESPERGDPGRAVCPDPSEAVSEGCGGSVWEQPVINYAQL